MNSACENQISSKWLWPFPPSIDQPTFAEVFEEDLLICTEGNAGHHNRPFHRTDLTAPVMMGTDVVLFDSRKHVFDLLFGNMMIPHVIVFLLTREDDYEEDLGQSLVSCPYSPKIKTAWICWREIFPAHHFLLAVPANNQSEFCSPRLISSWETVQ